MKAVMAWSFVVLLLGTCIIAEALVDGRSEVQNVHKDADGDFWRTQAGVLGTEVLRASSHKQLGEAIGKKYKSQIHKRLKAMGPQLQKAQEYASTISGKASLLSLITATAEAFPQYWEEMVGIALGSEVSVDQITILNFRQELSILEDQESGVEPSGVDDCSDVLLDREEDGIALVGHNEDNSADNIGTAYFVFADAGNETSRYQWAAYTYAGELSTAAWGWNSYGVCFTLNAVYADNVHIHGVGRNFVSRSILDASSLDDAKKRIQVGNQATGHNINVIGLDDRKIVTIETGPGNESDAKVVHHEAYFHANAYLRLDISQTPGPSSYHRQDRASELPEARNRTGVLTILGDTKDAKYPIWRSGSDDEYTLVTCLFDLYKETVEIIYGNPKANLTQTDARLGRGVPLRQRPVETVVYA